MTEQPDVCPHCGEPVQGDSYYCGGCGKAVVPSDRPVAGRKLTMLGVMPGAPLPPAEPDAPVPAEPTERTTDVGISEPAPGAMGRTKLGMPPPQQQVSPFPPADRETKSNQKAERREKIETRQTSDKTSRQE